QLLNQSGDIDIYVVSGEGELPKPVAETGPAPPIRLGEYFKAALIAAACALLSWMAHAFGLAEANIVMIFLAGVALVSARLGRGPSIASAIASVLVFDFFFVAPRLSFVVSDWEYLITFAVMLGIGLLISELASRLKSQLRASQQQEHRTSQLFRMTRQLSELAGSDFLLRTAGRQLEEIFKAEVAFYLREVDGKLSLRYGERT